MAPKAKPQLYAGQAKPDEDFYNRTFKADQISQKDLIRGLCINNPVARRVDDFLDKLLRLTLNHLVLDEDGQTRGARYWELDFGRETQLIFDSPIIQPLIKEFECFRSQWMLENEIPWSWHCSAIRIWIRNNRAAMKKDPRLQSAGGGYIRRYRDYSTNIEASPSERQKKSAPPVHLIDCVLVGVPKKSVKGTLTVVDEDGLEKQVAASQIVNDDSRVEAVAKVVDVLKKGSSMQQIVKGVQDTRYNMDGDIAPMAIFHGRAAELEIGSGIWK